MKQLTFLLLSLIVFSSCRKDFAYFQHSKDLTYLHKKNAIKTEIHLPKTEPILTASVEDLPVFIDQNESFSDETIAMETKSPLLDDGRKRKKKRARMSQKEDTFMEKIFPNQTHKDKKSTKKRRNPVPFNSTIYTGFIILGIAIVLALVSLSSLSLLFGLASIVLLYFGFKKYFRKKRRRDIFR